MPFRASSSMKLNHQHNETHYELVKFVKNEHFMHPRYAALYEDDFHHA